MGTDWQQVELDYRTGVMSIGMVCRVHCISRQRLMDRVAVEGWSRDLMTQVRAEVNERLYMNRLQVEAEQDHISAAAQAMVDVIRNHRQDIGQLRETISQTVEQVNEVLNAEVMDDGLLDKGRVVARSVQASLLFGKTQGVVGALDTLASAMQRLVTLERQAFGMESISSATLPVVSATDTSSSNALIQITLPHNSRDPLPA